MGYFKKKVILNYLYSQLTGNFMGFVVGISASGIVSQFFETRSIRNLWGLGSKKTIIDKETFGILEWVISIVIGFIFFEVMTKVVKAKLDRNFPVVKRRIFRFLVRQDYHLSMRAYLQTLHSRRLQLISAVHVGMRHAINRFGKK